MQTARNLSLRRAEQQLMWVVPHVFERIGMTEHVIRHILRGFQQELCFTRHLMLAGQVSGSILRLRVAQKNLPSIPQPHSQRLDMRAVLYTGRCIR